MVAISWSLLGAHAGELYAEGGGIQEVVVTAEKREETLQNTPIAMAAFSGDQLTNLGVTDFSGVAVASPSIYFAPYPSSSNTLQLFMRGQGNGDPGQITSDGAVGLYLDGIYIARPQASTFDLADVERIEVLRGPQGTLYGRNTTGGAVNIISREPTGEFGLKQTLSFGNYNYFRSLTAIDLPKVGNVATKLTLLKSNKDGWVKNSDSSHDYGEEEQLAGRFALRWDISDALTLNYSMEKGSLDSTPMYFYNKAMLPSSGGLPNYTVDRKRTYRPIDLEKSNADYEGHGLTLTWDVSDALTIKSLTGYRELSTRYFQNYAEAYFVFFHSDDLIRNHQFSQEIQFSGLLFDDRIQYAAGLYYFNEGGSHDQVINQGAPVSPYFIFGSNNRYVSAQSSSRAAYAQAIWTPDLLDDRLDLTLGARYTIDKREAERTSINLLTDTKYEDGISNSQRFKRFNPALTANFKWTEDVSSYAKVTTGYRAGGSSESGPDFTETFGPEKVITYELGFKSIWWDHRVRANVAAFKTDYRDMQVLITPVPNDLSITQTVNAGRARINGVELDLTVAPIDDLTLNVSYTYLDPRMLKVEDPANGEDITGRYAVPFAPENAYNIAADYTFYRFSSGALSAHLNYRWQDAAYLSGTSGPDVPNGDYFQRPAYGLLDGRVTMELELPRGDRARLAVWGKNLTDKVYKEYTVGLGNYMGYLSQAFTYGEPRTFGIDVSYEY